MRISVIALTLALSGACIAAEEKPAPDDVDAVRKDLENLGQHLKSLSKTQLDNLKGKVNELAREHLIVDLLAGMCRGIALATEEFAVLLHHAAAFKCRFTLNANGHGGSFLSGGPENCL